MVQGSIKLAATNALPSSTTLSLAGPASLDLAGNDQTLESVNGSGSVTNSSGSLSHLILSPASMTATS